MNTFLKIVLWVIGVVVVLAIALFVWAYNKVSIPDLDILDSDTVTRRIEKADAWLQKLQEDQHFNGAVLLIKNDSVILKNTYGFADHRDEQPLTNESMFRLASVSKQFTAAGIMLLKSQNKISLDNSITRYLPELPYNSVTIRHLLNHTSGIADVYMSFPEKYPDIVGDLLTNAKVVELLAKENLPLKTEPNSKYQYSNTGYILLASIIERISNQSFEDFMKEELFDKLKMRQTRVWNLLSKETMFENKVASFSPSYNGNMLLTPSTLDGVAGDGAIFSSINDFEKWNQFWYANNLIPNDVLQEAFKKPMLKDGETSDYGFGWLIANADSHWHNGSWLGARTLIIRNTKLKNCMVILDNSSSLNVDNIARQLTLVLK